MSFPTSLPKIAYQGIAGAYHEQAVLQFMPDCEPVGYASFEAAFEAAVTGACDYACLAVENSLAGSVNPTYNLLRESSLHIIAEQIVPIQHCLLVCQGGTLEHISRVYSHYQALAQCQGFIEEHGLEAVVDYDTAGAAKNLAARADPSQAAIASARAADIYQLDILAHAIQDDKSNFTRFFVLGQQEAERETGKNYKTSLVLATHHRAGELVRCLQVLAEHGVNMSKLESQPRRDKPWSYLFYIDVDGHIEDDNMSKAMTALMRKAAYLKFLGSYPI